MRRLVLAAGAMAALGLGAAFQPAASADLVCFGTTGRGLVCLNDGKVESHTRESSALPSNGVGGLVACGDKIVAAIGGAVMAYDGKSWSPPNRPAGGAFASKIACAGPGKYWASTLSGAAHWDGAGWKAYPSKEIFGDVAGISIFDIAAGPDGTVWIAANNGIAARYQGGAWTVFKEGQGFDKRYPFTRIFVDARSRAWIPAGGAVLAFRDDKWVPVPGMRSFSGFTSNAAGRIWYESGQRITSVDGDRRAEYEHTASIRSIAVDENGFVWAATEFGIARLDGGGKFESRHMHDSALTDDDFNTVAVLGKGSPLPPRVERPVGSLTGRLAWSDGKPVAGAELQFCGVTAALMSGGEGPCGKRPLFASAIADADGKFTVAKAPAAAYRMAVKPVGARRWVVFLGTSDRLRVGPGEAKDAGTLGLDVRHRDAK